MGDLIGHDTMSLHLERPRGKGTRSEPRLGRERPSKSKKDRKKEMILQNRYKESHRIGLSNISRGLAF